MTKVKLSRKELLDLVFQKMERLEFDVREMERHNEKVDEHLLDVHLNLQQLDDLIKDLHPLELGT